jgi:CubicO group peptidase (beta-lactamase class C family)
LRDGRRPLLLAVAALLLAGCGASERSAPPLSQRTLTVAARGGFDPELLGVADRRLDSIPGLQSVLVMRDGRLVFERYYDGTTRDDEHEIFSVTKSILSALIGIAAREGRFPALDSKFVEFFPDQLQPDADPRIREITLRELLTMTAGYADTGPGETDNSVTTLMNRPLESDPGTAFAYDSGSAHLLAAVLAKTTGVPAAAFARRRLFGPLGIRPAYWYADGQGRSLGSTGLALRPRELARFGQLYLQQGRWRGRQLVPLAWLFTSTTAHVQGGDGCGYGYLWWVCPKSFYALGALGQTIGVYPRRNLVLVTTGDYELDRSEVEEVLFLALVR